MEQRTLGPDGPRVSRVALGTMTFGQEADEQASHAILDTYLTAGGTLVDTADVYSDGESERIIGRWLGKNATARDQIVLATKGRFPITDQPGPGLSRDYLRRALDASLYRLGVDHIDIYQAHGPDPRVPLDEFALFAEEAQAAGKVTHVGLSNFPGWQTSLAHALCRQHGARPPVSLQPQYSLLVREPEWEIMPAAEALGMGTMVWGPLGAGWLTGKYRRDERPPAGSRLGDDPNRGLEALDRRGTERTWRIVDTLLRLAGEAGVPPAQVALAWVLQRPGVTSALVGARTPQQLTTSLPVADLRLDPALVAQLEEVSAPQTPDYPYRFVEEISAMR
ncbi:aldo/keto reductase [Micromonospora sp. NPDC049374]|uniref:aldo/keto reductase n=1 Tax=Micromonospora sp. NPDC049374 TaxID=3154352 RepID=UPI0034469422